MINFYKQHKVNYYEFLIVWSQNVKHIRNVLIFRVKILEKGTVRPGLIQ